MFVGHNIMRGQSNTFFQSDYRSFGLLGGCRGRSLHTKYSIKSELDNLDELDIHKYRGCFAPGQLYPLSCMFSYGIGSSVKQNSNLGCAHIGVFLEVKMWLGTNSS